MYIICKEEKRQNINLDLNIAIFKINKFQSKYNLIFIRYRKYM